MKAYTLVLVTALLLGCSWPSNEPFNTFQADVVIYGSTPAAVMAAVQLSKQRKNAIIVCPERHIGGLSSSGLGFTDTGNKAVIGGLAREFYQRIYKYYQQDSTWKWQPRDEYGNKGQGTPAIDGDNRTMWIFEPHIAEAVFNDLLRENHVTVFRDEWLDRKYGGVSMEDGRITSITTLSGKSFSAEVFIDATYEGDLMAAAGVDFFVGRESNKVYGETFNGSQPDVFHHGHNFGDMQVSPYVVPGDPSSGLVPRVSSSKPVANGEGDKHVQAYCYRLCLTKDDRNRIPFERPLGYDSTQYELLLRVYAKGWRETFNKFDPIPNHKTDVNNHGPFSFDNIGMSDAYPEADYDMRASIIDEHIRYQKGLLYFMANDPRMPDDVRSEMAKWGLSKDEFTDNSNWPYQLYIREARRMIGSFVMTENEIMGKNDVPEPIGMGSYTMDSHNVQRYVTNEGFVQNEGDIGVHPHNPYQIALGTILPKKEQCSNLIVPAAVSSSHIAFGSIRMEPVFMILGQSAGTVAALAVTNNKAVQDVPYDAISKRLTDDGQIIQHEITEGN